MTTKFTSKDNGHSHTWNSKLRYTSTDHSHRHKINLTQKIALRADGHTHKLLSKVRQNGGWNF